jgi:hypothetical protein
MASALAKRAAFSASRALAHCQRGTESTRPFGRSSLNVQGGEQGEQPGE